MKCVQNFCLVLIIILGCFSFGRAQQTISVSGGNGTSSTGTISYTLGQVDYTSTTSSGFTISNGVQQAFEIFDVTGISFAPIKFNFSLFPNPATNLVTLSIDSIGLENLTYRVIDLAGREMESGDIFNVYTQIPVDGFADGTYMICVLRNQNLLHSFLLVKH